MTDGDYPDDLTGRKGVIHEPGSQASRRKKKNDEVMFMKYKIRGTTMQVVDVELEKGASVFSEKGGMGWMSPNIRMETSTRGGLMKGLGRMLAGESFFLTTYTCEEGTGLISFTSEFPGKVIAMSLKDGQSLICQKDAFMMAQEGVSLEISFQKKLGAGFFGGEGFVLQKVSGPGDVFLEISGEVTEYTLKPGQILKIDPGHIAMFEPEVKYDISRVKGIKNMLFGGEGIFLATLEGPGKVWLQSMPLSGLARRLMKFLPTRGN